MKLGTLPIGLGLRRMLVGVGLVLGGERQEVLLQFHVVGWCVRGGDELLHLFGCQ